MTAAPTSLRQHQLSGVYEIRNSVTGGVYIGSSVRAEKRWREHRHDLAAGRHHSAKLQNAWNKYGGDAFVFTLLEHVERESLLKREQWWIDRLAAASRTNYNACVTAGSQAGRTLSEAHKQRLRELMLGNKRGLGVRLSPEARARMSAARVGQKRSAEARARMSLAQMGNTKKRGYIATAATRAKLSAAMRGNRNAKGTAA